MLEIFTIEVICSHKKNVLYSGVQQISLCTLFVLFVFVVRAQCLCSSCVPNVCVRLACPMLLVSLDCQFLIATSVFSNIYLSHIMWLCLTYEFGDSPRFVILHSMVSQRTLKCVE